MIEILLIVFLILSVTHYVYESCVLPELRLHFVYRLFRLRDDLRRAKLHNEISDDGAYDVIQGSLNNSINFVFLADYRLLSEVRHAIKTKPEVAKVTEKRLRVLDESKDGIIEDVRRQSRKIFSYALVTGMGGLCLYLVPMACLFVFFGSVKNLIKSTLAMPTRQLNKATEDREDCEQSVAVA